MLNVIGFLYFYFGLLIDKSISYVKMNFLKMIEFFRGKMS